MNISQWARFQVRARRLFNRIPFQEHQKLYFLTLLIGVACGLAAVTFHVLLEYFQTHLIYRAAAMEGWTRPVLLFVIPAVGGLIAGAGLYFYAAEARGSGIPQVKKSFYLESGRIRARVIWSKMVLAAINIGTGASLGREGPTVQICAGIASLLGRIFVVSRKTLQSLVPVGAAAGLAAAFNTPIAAVTFTLEELLGDTARKPLGSIVVASVIAAVIERSILGGHALFEVPHYVLKSPYELPIYAVLGIVSGVASLAFNRGLLGLRKYFREQKKIPQWATPAVGALILSAIAVPALYLTGSPSIFGVGYKELSVELQHNLPLKVVLILGIFKLVGTVVSYGSGSSGGIFGPSLFIGGMLGGAVGTLAGYIPAIQHADPGAYALVGMGAVFAGIVRAPVTSIIIIFEMTDNYSIILPLMMANILSYALARRVDPIPIYDALLRQDGVFLPHTERSTLRQIPARKAMSKHVVTVDGESSVEDVFHLVQTFPVHHHCYPALDGLGNLAGVCTFNDLKRAMASGHGSRLVKDVAARKTAHVFPDTSLDAVILRIGRTGFAQLPVVSRKDPRRLLGIITMQDVAETLASEDGDSTASGKQK